jgi:hypothetical protein
MLSYDEAIVFSSAVYNFRADVYLYKNNTLVQLGTKIEVINDSRSWPIITPIIWKNDKGGFSTSLFNVDRQHLRKATTQKYMDSTNLDKVYDAILKNNVVVKKPIANNTDGTLNQISFYNDILQSKILFWHRGLADLVPISIAQEENPFESSDSVVPILNFEYIP